MNAWLTTKGDIISINLFDGSIKIVQKITESNDSATTPVIIRDDEHALLDREFTIEELLSIFDECGTSTATGPDQVSYNHLRSLDIKRKEKQLVFN